MYKKHTVFPCSDADLVADDGLYSARLTSYPALGRYSFRILVEGRPEATLTPPLGEVAASGTPCCGSSTHLLAPPAASRLTPTGDFTRSVLGPVVYISQLPDVRRLPPSKVNDLRANVIDEDNSSEVGGRLEVSWTSPGGDYNLGVVASCRLVYGPEVFSLLDPTMAPDLLTVIPRSDLQPAGLENRQLVVEFPHRGVDYYLGVVCLDAEGNRGRMSNLVAVMLPAVDLGPEDGGEGATETDSEAVQGLGLLSSEKDWIMVGVICGILLVLIVISVVSISYFCCVSSRRRNGLGGTGGNNSSTKGGRERKTSSASISDVHVASSGSSDHTDGTDAGSFDSDMKNLSGNNLVLPGSSGYADPHELDFGGRLVAYARQLDVESPTSSSIKDEDDEERGGPPGYQQHPPQQQQQQQLQQPHHRLRRLLQSTTARGTPVYWSASQLLSKLEEDGTHPSSSVSPPHSAYSMQNEVYSYQCGGLNRGLGVGHHMMEYGGEDNSSRHHHSLPGGIPDEFCVTVSNLPSQQQQRYSSDTDSGIEQTVVSLQDELPRLHHNNNSSLQHHNSTNLHRSSYRERLPPPLYPKPKNITQV